MDKFLNEWIRELCEVTRGLLGIRKIDKVTNVQIKELCGVSKTVDERIDEGFLW